MIRGLLLTAVAAFICAASAASCDRGSSDSTPSQGTTAGGTAAASKSSKPRIVLIPKGTTHAFWQTVQAGAQEEADARGVELVWKGPLQESEKGQQIEIVEQFVAEGVAGIGVAPLDRAALLEPIQSARAKNIPVVIFDSSLDGEPGKDFNSYVATDNKKGGFMAGVELARLLGGKGKVVLLRYDVGSASTEQREAGFLEAINANPGIEVISANQYAGATASKAQEKASNMVDDLKRADGIFASNESATQGMLAALDSNGLTGKVKFVGFDASKTLVQAMKEGKIDALVSQDPRNMGRLTVSTLMSVIRGEKVEQTIDTGAHLVTKANLETPEIQKLLASQLK